MCAEEDFRRLVESITIEFLPQAPCKPFPQWVTDGFAE